MSDNEKSDSRERDLIEDTRVEAGKAKGENGVSYVDHREGDDREDTAKGRNSDTVDKKYWLSVNYIGTMFAIGVAFMGGIGGELCRCKIERFNRLLMFYRLWFDRASSYRDQQRYRAFAKHQLGTSGQLELRRRFLPYGRATFRYLWKEMVWII